MEQNRPEKLFQKLFTKGKEEREKEEEEEKNVTEIGNRKIKRVFNEVFLNNLKNQEIRKLKKKGITGSYKEKINENKTKTIKTKKNMAEDIKEDLNDTTFFERNILKFNKEYNIKLYNQKIKKLEDYTLEEYLKYLLKKEERKQEEEKAKNKGKNSDDVDLGEESEMMEIDNELGEEVEKEMKKNKKDDEIPEDEETKVELNEDNQEILNKIKELKKFEKKNEIYLYCGC